MVAVPASRPSDVAALRPFDDGRGELWRALLSPNGRASRREFWLYFGLVVVGLELLLKALLEIAGWKPELADATVSLLVLWPALAVPARRWHDRNKSGWWSLIVLVPVLGLAWMFWECGLRRGTVGANRYGADPLTPRREGTTD